MLSKQEEYEIEASIHEAAHPGLGSFRMVPGSFDSVSVPTPVAQTRAQDTVNHPTHYNKGKYEVIDVIEDWSLDFHLGNCVKYIARAPHKGKEIEDLKKARWYLDRRLEHLEQLASVTDDITEADIRRAQKK